MVKICVFCVSWKRQCSGFQQARLKRWLVFDRLATWNNWTDICFGDGTVAGTCVSMTWIVYISMSLFMRVLMSCVSVPDVFILVKVPLETCSWRYLVFIYNLGFVEPACCACIVFVVPTRGFNCCHDLGLRFQLEFLYISYALWTALENTHSVLYRIFWNRTLANSNLLTVVHTPFVSYHSSDFFLC